MRFSARGVDERERESSKLSVVAPDTVGLWTVLCGVFTWGCCDAAIRTHGTDSTRSCPDLDYSVLCTVLSKSKRSLSSFEGTSWINSLQVTYVGGYVHVGY